MPWFVLPAGFAPTNPASYILVGILPVCWGTNRICAINAAVDLNGLPIISGALRDEMIDALNSRTYYPNVILKF